MVRLESLARQHVQHHHYHYTAGSNAVTLLSTLKQGSLCPGDGGVTLTCAATGTDLTWLVGGRMMSYNANARVGSIRSNAESDEIAILMRVDTIGGSGIAHRMSVLHVNARPHATEPLRVQCHNGTTHFAEEVIFWRKEAGTQFYFTASAVTNIFAQVLLTCHTFCLILPRRTM